MDLEGTVSSVLGFLRPEPEPAAVGVSHPFHQVLLLLLPLVGPEEEMTLSRKRCLERNRFFIRGALASRFALV